jgi:apolipoprotein N-acyltransferase
MWLRRNGRLIYGLASGGFFLAIFVWLAVTASLEAAVVARLPFVIILGLALYLASRTR